MTGQGRGCLTLPYFSSEFRQAAAEITSHVGLSSSYACMLLLLHLEKENEEISSKVISSFQAPAFQQDESLLAIVTTMKILHIFETSVSWSKKMLRILHDALDRYNIGSCGNRQICCPSCPSNLVDDGVRNQVSRDSMSPSRGNVLRFSRQVSGQLNSRSSINSLNGDVHSNILSANETEPLNDSAFDLTFSSLFDPSLFLSL